MWVHFDFRWFKIKYYITNICPSADFCNKFQVVCCGTNGMATGKKHVYIIFCVSIYGGVQLQVVQVCVPNQSCKRACMCVSSLCTSQSKKKSVQQTNSDRQVCVFIGDKMVLTIDANPMHLVQWQYSTECTREVFCFQVT